MAQTRERRHDEDSGKTAAGMRPRRRGRPTPMENGAGRTRLIAATRELLRTVPPPKLTRQDVAAAAGVDPALVRYYFGSLSALLTEALKEQIEELRVVMAALAREKGTPAERLRRRVAALVRFLAENPAYHQLFVEQIVYGEGEWAAASRARVTRIAFGEWTSILDDGRADGTLREDVDARLFYVAMLGACEFFVRGSPLFRELFPGGTGRADLLTAYSEFLADFALHGIGRPPARRRAK
ncbi:MAG: TetR/AcrR family transcriptional regulator [Rhodospirillaceae bacterium]